MKIFCHIAMSLLCFSMVCTIFSCENSDSCNQKAMASDGENVMLFAKTISVTKYKSGYCVGNIFLYPDSLSLPDELENKMVIRTPVKSVVAYSSTQWSVFQRIGEINRIKGILEGGYTKNPEIKELIEEGKIVDLGFENHINIEKVIDIQPDVILFTSYSSDNDENISKLTKTVLLPYTDYLENHPLGRAEWIKIIGYLTCREELTDEWFDNIVTNYESIKSLCANTTFKPTIFSDLPFNGQWYYPGGKSYIAQIFNDAGADYVWKENESTASQPIDAEIVLAKAADADYWRIMNSTDLPYSYERLSIENELFTYFKAFKERHVIICDVLKSNYFESSVYEPDLLLKDFVKIFHPEQIEADYQPKYFYLLNE